MLSKEAKATRRYRSKGFEQRNACHGEMDIERGLFWFTELFFALVFVFCVRFFWIYLLFFSTFMYINYICIYVYLQSCMYICLINTKIQYG
jgi:hypothetical protein